MSAVDQSDTVGLCEADAAFAVVVVHGLDRAYQEFEVFRWLQNFVGENAVAESLLEGRLPFEGIQDILDAANGRGHVGDP